MYLLLMDTTYFAQAKLGLDQNSLTMVSKRYNLH